MYITKRKHRVSKFDVIDGSKKPENVVDINQIAYLEDTIKLKKGNLTQRDCYTYAYHFAIAGDFARAEKYLYRLTSSYLTTGIYKDLYKALLSHAMYENAPETEHARLQENYEFFIVVRRSIREFEKLSFMNKYSFTEMAKHMKKESTFTVI